MARCVVMVTRSTKCGAHNCRRCWRIWMTAVAPHLWHFMLASSARYHRYQLDSVAVLGERCFVDQQAVAHGQDRFGVQAHLLDDMTHGAARFDFPALVAIDNFYHVTLDCTTPSIKNQAPVASSGDWGLRREGTARGYARCPS